MAEPIRVLLAGYGKLGQVLAPAMAKAPDLELVGICTRTPKSDQTAFASGPPVPVRRDLAALLASTQPRVLVDSSVPEAVFGHVQLALAHQVSPVVATTGLTASQLDEIREQCARCELGAVVAPNFALGAVLLMHLAQLSARYFEHAEIIELHHDQKADAPSGTALKTAEGVVKRRGSAAAADRSTESVPGVRGGEVGGIRIHSVRLPGLVAHQEVLLAGPGQTLTIRHDSYERASFMPGVLAAVKKISGLAGLTYGLDEILDL